MPTAEGSFAQTTQCNEHCSQSTCTHTCRAQRHRRSTWAARRCAPRDCNARWCARPLARARSAPKPAARRRRCCTLRTRQRRSDSKRSDLEEQPRNVVQSVPFYALTSERSIGHGANETDLSSTRRSGASTVPRVDTNALVEVQLGEHSTAKRNERETRKKETRDKRDKRDKERQEREEQQTSHIGQIAPAPPDGLRARSTEYWRSLATAPGSVPAPPCAKSAPINQPRHAAAPTFARQPLVKTPPPVPRWDGATQSATGAVQRTRTARHRSRHHDLPSPQGHPGDVSEVHAADHVAAVAQRARAKSHRAPAERASVCSAAAVHEATHEPAEARGQQLCRHPLASCSRRSAQSHVARPREQRAANSTLTCMSTTAAVQTDRWTTALAR